MPFPVSANSTSVSVASPIFLPESEENENAEYFENITKEAAQELAGSIEIQSEVPATKPSLISDLDNSLVGWDSENDPKNPRNWSSRTKLGVLILVGILGFMIPSVSTLFAPGEPLMAKEFHLTNHIVQQLTISVYVLGFGWGPLVHAPMSEMYGRQYVILISNILFTGLNLGCSEARNVAMLLVFRLLTSICGCAGMVVGAGIISDLYPPEEIGRATAVFMLGPIMGPMLGPILGGFISQRAGWRWTIRVIICMGGVMTVVLVLLVPETNAAVLLRRKAASLAKSTGRIDLVSIIDSRLPKVSPRQRLATAFVRVAKLLCISPVIQMFTLFMLIAYAYLYIFFTTITLVMTTKYGWPMESAGLAFIGIGCGTAFSVAVVGGTNDKLVKYLTKRNGGVRQPEMRLGPLLFGSIMIPTAMFWYGWAVQRHVHWFVVIMSFFPCGAGMIASLHPTQAYLIDLYGPLGAAASATAALNLTRCTAAALIPLCVPSLIARFDYGLGYSILGILGFALCSSMSVFFVWYGQSFRERFPPRI
ncbi:major facilitator superfamily domain-containing protein [Lipomyces arxii]|uniref:major facilitator superfamily domain-containing protein n=1 Tax=Lipomyces arxii TaxID=56418 RepID=UPI0034CE5E36